MNILQCAKCGKDIKRKYYMTRAVCNRGEIAEREGTELSIPDKIHVMCKKIMQAYPESKETLELMLSKNRYRKLEDNCWKFIIDMTKEDPIYANAIVSDILQDIRVKK